MKNHKVAWLVTILLVALAIAFGQFKAPVQQSDSFYVTDNANLLMEDPGRIYPACIDLAQETGARMVIVTVKHTGLKSMESYAETLWDSWKLSGIDLLLVMKSDDYYFLYGSELSQQMDNHYRTLLDRHLEPKFAVKDYDDAVLDFISGTKAVLLSTDGDSYEVWDDTFYVGDDVGSVLSGAFLFVLIVVVIVLISNNRPAAKRRYYGGYASPGRSYTRPIVIHTRPTMRPSSRPGSFGGGFSSGSRSSGFGGGSRGGSFGGGGGRGGGSRGGGGRR